MNDHPLAGIAPPPPPAPTPADGARAAAQTQRWVESTIDPNVFLLGGRPPVAQAQAQPAPQPQPTQDAQPPAPAKPKKKPNVYAYIVGGVLVAGLGWAYTHRATQPTTPSQLEQNVAALATQVSALAAGAPAATVEVNPLSAMPCAVTTDARRFIGVDGTGRLDLAGSVRIARLAYDLYRNGTDYRAMRIGTGVSLTQLEVFPGGTQGVTLFDCGTPANAGNASAAPATTVKKGE